MGQAPTLDLGQHAASMIMPSQPNQPRRETREQELLAMYNKLGDAAEVILSVRLETWDSKQDLCRASGRQGEFGC